MKRKNIYLRKFLIVLALLGSYFILGGNFQSITSASSGNVIGGFNSKLQNENIKLKGDYAVLENRMREVESQLERVYEVDNSLYAQMMGVDYDTTDYHLYRNDSARMALSENDSMFNNLNNRSIYAAEMLALQLVKLEETSDWFQNNKSIMHYYPTISPIKTQDFIYVSSPYGMRTDPITKKTAYHEGLDISANIGVPIHATASGRIVHITYSKYGYGNKVLISHRYGFETLYAHMGVISVKKGQWVNKNQVIGTVGNTGKSTGSHLHYEIHKNGQPRDPMGYFYTHLTDELLAMN